MAFSKSVDSLQNMPATNIEPFMGKRTYLSTTRVAQQQFIANDMQHFSGDIITDKNNIV